MTSAGVPLPKRSVVAIIGGGFSGAAVAYHLAGASGAAMMDIVVIEPREWLGGGLAYSSGEQAHRINVPASKMSLIADDPEHFSRWLAESRLLECDAVSVTALGDAFPQRAVFGRYVREALTPHIASGKIQHLRARGLRASMLAHGGFSVDLSDGTTLSADRLVIATTHPLPDVPSPLHPLIGSSAFWPDPYDPATIAGIACDARVLVVGNGLTAADIVAALDRRGHVGPILALSRHGLRSRGHPKVPTPAFGDFASEPATTASTLLARISRAIDEAALSGIGWHGVLDTLRRQGPDIWSALPIVERRRIVRHLRAFWDVHRFRIAPQVEAVLDRRTAEGTFRSIAASLQDSRLVGQSVEVTWRRRHSGVLETRIFDAVVNTTGPAHRSIVTRPGPVASLCDAGLVRLDGVGLGLDTALDGRAIGSNARPVDGLFIAGPLARGTFGELMGLLEVTRYSQYVASQVGLSLEAALAATPPSP